MMNDMQETLLGSFASWEIISKDIAVKHCDNHTSILF